MHDLLGYASSSYAFSLQEFGKPRELPNCGGWILERSIPGTPHKDGIGCYPLFSCRDWTKLPIDLEEIGSDLVSIALVADPFSAPTQADLERCFDIVKPFKMHYVTNLSCSPESIIHRDHRYKARKALEIMDVEICPQPIRYLEEWGKLYAELVSRHDLTGIHAFSHECFETQLKIPGMVMLLGRLNGEIVGAILILIADQVAFSHLTALSSVGYRIRASYGLHWKAILYLQEHGIKYFNHGGVAGLRDCASDGLAHFKSIWSNERRMAYFCGRVLESQKYESICKQEIGSGSDFFPAYRIEGCL